MKPRMMKRLRFNEVFQEEMLTIDQYLEGIGKEDLHVAIAGIINAVYDDRFHNANNLIANWLGNNPVIRDDLYGRFQEADSIINIYSSLKFAEHILSIDDLQVETTLSDQEKELNLLKAYLTLNTAQEQIENEGREDIPDNDPFNIKMSCFNISMSIHDYELTNYSLVEVFISQLGKSIEFFRYLSSRTALNPHLEYFLQKYDCASWQDWLRKYLAILPSLVTEENKAYFDITIPVDENYEESTSFLSLLSLNDEADFHAYDFIELRTKPLFRISDNKYRILFKLFTLEKLFKSIQFEFSLTINTELPEVQRISNFRSDHCDIFSEQTLLYNVTDRSFPNRWVKLKGSDFVEHSFEAEPDYYLRFKNKLFLFESKDVVLRGEVKQSRNYSILKKEIQNKLYKIDDNGRIKKKAILQLIANIKRILEKYYAVLDDAYNPDCIKIYPIIIIHDRSFDSLGLNQLIRQWFNTEIALLSRTLNINNVREVVILNIDKLVLHQDLFRTRQIRLEEIIDNYLQQTNMDSIADDDGINGVNRCMVSFSGFLEAEIRRRRIQRIPIYISEFAQQYMPE